MRTLLKAELLRFRGAAAAGAVAHAGILGIVAAVSDLFTASPEKLGLGLIVYAGLGLFLGVYQVGSYRRLGSYTYLLHRPLAPSRILLALAGAASLLLTFVAGLPLLLATVLSRLGPHGADARSFLMTPLVVGICIAFHLAGVFLVLSPSPARFAVLLIPGVFLYPRLSPALTFLALAGAIVWLWILASAAFRPDLSSHLDAPVAIAALAVPAQLALLPALSILLLFVYSTGVAVSEVGWRNITEFSWNRHFPEDTFQSVNYLEPGDALALALRRSGTPATVDPEAALELIPGHRQPQRRGQLMVHDRHQSFRQDARGLVFTFSNDLMLWKVSDARTGRADGWLGPEGRAEDSLPAARFDEVPEVVDERFLVGQRRILDVLPDLSVKEVFQAAGGERIVDVLLHSPGPVIAVLTDQALHLLEPRPAAVALGGDVRNLSRAIVAPAGGDITLVSFVFGAQGERDGAPAHQTVARVDTDGRVEALVDLPLAQGPPAWARHRTFLVAPLHSVVLDVARRQPIGRPPAALILAASLIAVLSGACTWWIARRRGLPPAARFGWSVSMLLTSVPGFLVFLLLTPRAEPP